jgi:hypothetical protein
MRDDIIRDEFVNIAFFVIIAILISPWTFVPFGYRST